MSLSTLLQIEKKDIVAIVGCGGKTTFLTILSEENSEGKVLMSTTTKIYKKINTSKPPILVIGDTNALAHEPTNGIQVLVNDDANPLKYQSLKEETLAQIKNRYDTIFLECDGSKGLFLKWWSENEPVIPHFVTKTIGIMTLNGLGSQINEASVHRADLFAKNTNSCYNDVVQESHLLSMVLHPQGMFKNARGKKILILNYIEDDADRAKAKHLVYLIQQNNTVGIEQILLANGKEKTWTEGEPFESRSCDNPWRR